MDVVLPEFFPRKVVPPEKVLLRNREQGDARTEEGDWAAINHAAGKEELISCARLD